ncbi:ParA family protein [Vibrio parahaemolyticus]|nr:ParA family protein [Vibrio parahaemolyticus]
MSQKFILLMASKGGVGKSVLAKQFSRELFRLGHSLEMVDYDPQQHFAKFAEANPAIFCENGEFVIIDTQGAHTETNVQLMEAMKDEDAVIVVPFKPTDDEYTEALRMRNRLKDHGLLNKAVFVANGVLRANDKDAKMYRELLSSSVKVSKSMFIQRKAYAKEPDSAVISEISKFLNEIVL